MTDDSIEIPTAPAIPGLKFRHFRGPSDYPLMVAVATPSIEADQIEHVVTVEEIARFYANLTNSNPAQDMLFAEINGEVVGYARAYWYEEGNGQRFYGSVGRLVPAWRRQGLGRTLLRWVEARLRQIARDHPAETEKFLQGFATHGETSLAALLEREGYTPARYGWDMVRPTLDDLPEYPLPEGLEVRPVLPEHYRAIWDASTEAFRDHWGFVEPTEKDYETWQTEETIFQPHLWQIAWDVASDQVAGQVRTYIDHAQNEKYGRKRGYTEFISVRRPWRRRGLARALIARSLAVQKQHGMTESTLSVDSENWSGATRVYEDCGFRVVKQNTIYRKPLELVEP